MCFKIYRGENVRVRDILLNSMGDQCDLWDGEKRILMIEYGFCKLLSLRCYGVNQQGNNERDTMIYNPPPNKKERKKREIRLI